METKQKNQLMIIIIAIIMEIITLIIIRKAILTKKSYYKRILLQHRYMRKFWLAKNQFKLEITCKKLWDLIIKRSNLNKLIYYN